jgi:hypothetical protein
VYCSNKESVVTGGTENGLDDPPVQIRPVALMWHKGLA